MGSRRDTATRWITRVAYTLCLVALAGCGEAGGAVVGAAVRLSDIKPTPGPNIQPSALRNLGPEAVEIRHTRLLSTPGGCEIEVTYRNTTDRSLSIGFTYRTFDAQGHELKSLSTPVTQTGPGETRTTSSGTTTEGPSGIPCTRIARTEIKGVAAWTS